MSTHTRSPAAELSTLKTVSIVLAFTAAVGLTLGTVGFASMDVDRGIEVGVVDDESAYLVANPNDTLVVNASSTAVVYKNGFDTELDDFSVHVTSTSATVNVTAEAPDRLDVGESKPVNVTVETESPPEEPIELQLEVTASGDGVNVEMSRAYEFHLVSDVDD